MTDPTGTSSTLSGLSYDCASPRNIDDAELDPSLEQLPPSRGIITFTDTSFLHLAMQTLELRVELCRKINDLKVGMGKHESFDHEDDIRRAVSILPRWQHPRSLHARTLLELQLMQFLTFLHTPSVVRVESHRDIELRSHHGMVTVLKAAARTIDLHQTLVKSGNYALIRTRNDFFRSALLICHIAFYATKANGKSIQYTGTPTDKRQILS